jgi:hypothetical protein
MIPKILNRMGMGPFSRLLLAGILLEVFENLLSLRRRKVGPYPHVEHDVFPVRRRELGGISFRVATVTVDGV